MLPNLSSLKFVGIVLVGAILTVVFLSKSCQNNGISQKENDLNVDQAVTEEKLKHVNNDIKNLKNTVKQSQRSKSDKEIEAFWTEELK